MSSKDRLIDIAESLGWSHFQHSPASNLLVLRFSDQRINVWFAMNGRVRAAFVVHQDPRPPDRIEAGVHAIANMMISLTGDEDHG
jgi:CO dehydrogenase/acetyl-CoA synthase gamma subunit (corrinoid Fe-S protein)